MSKNLLKILVLLVFTSIIMFGCVKDSDTAIKINDKIITRGEFNKELDQAKKIRFAHDPSKLNNKNSYAILSLKEEVVNNLIKNELLKQEFKKRNITASPEEIAKERARIVGNFGSEEQFRNMMAEENLTEEQLLKDMTNEVKMQKLIKEVAKVDVTDEEAEKFYNKNKSAFMVPERARIMQILIEVNPEAIKRQIVDADKEIMYSTSEIDRKIDEEIQKKEAFAKEVQKKAAANPANFANIAKQYSDDKATSDKGGDLGYVTREMLNREFGDAAFSQPVGVVGPVGRSEFGYHIIYVKDKLAEGIEPFNIIKQDLKAKIRDEKIAKIMDEYINGLKNNATIEFVDKSLDPANIKKELDEILKKQVEGVAEKN